MSASRLFALAFGLMTIALIVLIVIASLETSLAQGLRDLTAGMWGIVTLVDLYIGLIFIAVWIGWLERSWWRTLLWTIGLFCFGNLTTAVYVVQRGWRADSLQSFFTRARKRDGSQTE